MTPPNSTPPHTAITKTIWFILVTLTTVVLSLIGAWAENVEIRDWRQDERITKVERQTDRMETMIEMLLRAQGLKPPPKSQ